MTFKERYSEERYSEEGYFKKRYFEEEDSSVSDIKSQGPSATEQQLKNDITEPTPSTEASVAKPSLGGPAITQAPEKGSDYLANALRPKTDTNPSLGDNQKFQSLVDRLSGRKTSIL